MKKYFGMIAGFLALCCASAGAVEIDFDKGYAADTDLHGQPAGGAQWERIYAKPQNATGFMVAAGEGVKDNAAAVQLDTVAIYRILPTANDLGGTFNPANSVLEYSVQIKMGPEPANARNDARFFIGSVNGRGSQKAAEIVLRAGGAVFYSEGAQGSHMANLGAAKKSAPFRPAPGEYFKVEGKVDYGQKKYSVAVNGVPQKVDGREWFDFQSNEVNDAAIRLQANNTNRPTFFDDIVLKMAGESNRVSVTPRARSFDFEGEFVPVRTGDETKSNITGVLPAGWQDDTAWAEADAEYSRYTQDPFAGKASLRVRLPAVRQGRLQLLVPDVPLSAQHYTKLTLAMKSPQPGPVRLGFRKNEPGWKTHWETTTSSNLEWETKEFLIPPLADDPAASFFVMLEQPAILDLDSLAFTPVPAQEIEAAFDTRGNLLTNSSFPNGLPAPWQMPIGESYRSDASTLGPTGASSLYLVPEMSDNGVKRAILIAPFSGPGQREYTVSYYLKGSKPTQTVSLQMGPPSKEIYQKQWRKDVTITNEWQRYSHTVKLPHANTGFYLAKLIAFADPLWVDGVQIEASGQAGEFRRAAPVELSAVPAKQLGLFFEDEPFELQVTALGDGSKPGAVVRSTLFDIAGQARELAPLKIGEQTLQTQAVKIPVGEKLPFGTHRLELRAYDAAGQPLSKPAEVLLHRVRRPRLANEYAPNSPFGIHVDRRDDRLQLARDLGFKWVRPFGMLEWKYIEPKQGEFRWAEADRQMALLEKHKMGVLAQLGDAPQWASNRPDGFNRYSQWYPKDLGDWEKYSRAVLDRYKGRIQHYETWNEPYWKRAIVKELDDKGDMVMATPAEYVSLQKRLYETARAVDAQARIAWVTNFVGSPEYNKAVVENGIYNYADLVAYHLYVGGGNPAPQLDTQIATIRETLPAEKKALPIWNSEGGPGPTDVHGYSKHFPPFGKMERSDAWSDFHVRYYLASLVNGTGKYFLYLLDPSQWWTRDYTILNADGTLAPSAIAISNLAWHLEGKQFVRSVSLPNEVTAHLFSGNGETVAVLLSQSLQRLKMERAPQGLVTRDMYGNTIPFPLELGEHPAFFTGAGLTADAVAGLLQP